MNAYTVEFEMRSLITNCNSSITRMTPCLEKAYDKLFGSDYNDIVRSKNLKQSFYFYNIIGFFSNFRPEGFTICQIHKLKEKRPLLL